MPNTMILPSVAKLDADLRAMPAMQGRYSPMVESLSAILRERFVSPTRVEEERQLAAV